MSDRVLLCMWRLSIKLLSKKSSWRADIVMRCPEVIYQKANKSRLTDHFNKIPGREEKRPSTIAVSIMLSAVSCLLKYSFYGLWQFYKTTNFKIGRKIIIRFFSNKSDCFDTYFRCWTEIFGSVIDKNTV